MQVCNTAVDDYIQGFINSISHRNVIRYSLMVLLLDLPLPFALPPASVQSNVSMSISVDILGRKKK